MTPPRPPRTIARAALHTVAACALIAALILLIAPICFTDSYRLWVVLFAGFRLSLPLGSILLLRWCLSSPGDVESGAARISAWAGICAAFAGIVWISEPAGFEMGLKDIPWFCLLIANESARLTVIRRAMRPPMIAIGAFGLALGILLSLGSLAPGEHELEALSLHTFGSFFGFVAARPWIAVICLAGLWLWVGLADRRPAAPASVPE